VLLLIMPGLTSGWLLTFLLRFDEATMTLVIRAPGTETLYIADSIDPLVTPVSNPVIAMMPLPPILPDRAYGLDRLPTGRAREG
jgi:putative spermidine/putrescine transport system permease protein